MPALRRVSDSDEQILIPALALFEWYRGPRNSAEMAALAKFIPEENIVPFGQQEATLSARLYRSLSRARSREIDICIAACAIIRDAPLWTLNPRDFADIPGLRLYRLS